MAATDPPQAMTAFVGMKMLLESIKAAGSTDYEKVIKAAAAADKPAGSYETGFGLKFDANMQNNRAPPVIAQWQDGKVRAVYPAEAAAADGKLVALQRK
jgi:branched-chain amino acid transport system substrate-binding protein